MPIIYLIGIAAALLATACRKQAEPEPLPLDLDREDALPEVKPRLGEVRRQLNENGFPDGKIDCGAGIGLAASECHPDGKIDEGELWKTTVDSYQRDPENEQLKKIVSVNFKHIAQVYYGKGVTDHFGVGPCSNISAFAKALLYDPNHQASNYYFGYCNRDPYFLQQAIALDPEDKQAWQALSQVFLEQGLFPEARETILSWLILHPKDGNAFKELGSLFFLEGKLPEAESALEAATYFLPLDGESYALLGILEFFKGNQAEAEKKFFTAAALDPAVNIALVSFLANEHLWDAAKRHLVLLGIQMPQYQNEIGGILLEIEREQIFFQPKAAPQFNKIPEKIPTNSTITL